MTRLAEAANVALAAAREAGSVVMRVYAEAFEVEFKGPDDPVTRADREANALLCDRLGRAFPGLPIVAEESDPKTYADFGRAEAAWFVDPLDGTREFVGRNGEFAVMIGLAEGGHARVGVILAPVWKRAFVGIVGEGAWEVATDGSRAPIRVSSRASLTGASLVVSRSRTSAALATAVQSMGAAPPTAHGSSGLKAALVACGTHDAYVQSGPAGMRWDACSSEALVLAAGGAFTDFDGAAIDYQAADLVNARGLVATNGHLHGAILEALRR